MISIEKDSISYINASIPSLPKGLDGLRGTSLANRELVVCGGYTGSSLSHEYLHYRDDSNHWATVATMKKARFSHSSVWIDGGLFTTGGCEPFENVSDYSDGSGPTIWLDDEEWQATSHHEIFSIEGGVQERREMPIPVGGHTATIFGPHQIIVCGGSPTRYVNKTFSIL